MAVGRVRRTAGSVLLRVLRRQSAGSAPKARVSVLLGVPHTSNLDYLLMLGVLWKLGVEPTFLGKDSLVRGPVGFLMRATGGIPVDRANPDGVAADMDVIRDFYADKVGIHPERSCPARLRTEPSGPDSLRPS